MSYVLGVLSLSILAVGLGLLRRDREPLDCHCCDAGNERVG